MKNVLIICGHPDFKNSVANKTIVEEISALYPQAEIRKVDELFVNGSFDVKAEQAAFENLHRQSYGARLGLRLAGHRAHG